MNFIDEINTSTILIIPANIKIKVLKYIDSLEKLVNIKIMDFNELKKHLYFDYDVEAILYLMEEYNYKYEVSKTLIDNMYYVDNIFYKDDKLNNLVKLKQELLGKNLIKKDSLFLDFINNKDVIVYGYDYIDSFNKKILSNFKNVKVIEKKIQKQNLVAHEFDNIFDEVNFVFSNIAILIEKGTDIEKIKITNVNENYHHALLALSKFYNIPIKINLNSTLSSTNIGKKFITKLNEISSTDEIKTYLDNIELNESNAIVYSKIINICNKYIGLLYSFSNIKNAIIYDINSTTISNNNISNAVEVLPFSDNVFTSDEYVFLMSFNQGESPSIAKDEDYISDTTKSLIGLDTCNTINTLRKNAFINNIYSINNLTITYKLHSISEEFYPSNLIKELGFNIEKDEVDTEYSKEYSKIVLGKMLDDLVKFDVKNNLLEKYYSSVDIPYMKYDNKFTGITRDSLIKNINNKLLLSYSTIDNYFRCSFRYYVSSILKIDKYEETFKTFIGNLFHFVLSQVFLPNFDYEECFSNYIKDKELTVSESFFLLKLKEELLFIIEQVKKLHQETGLTNALFEKKIYIDKSKDIDITFMGIVDKIMYKNIQGVDLVSIIDYKTGNPNTNLFNIIYGIDMQLPVYLYLVKYSNLFSPNIDFVGFYLQKILHGELTRSPNKTYLEQKIDNLKLVGYSTTNEEYLSRFDPTYEDSIFIKSMKKTSKGFYVYSKIIEDKKIDLLITLVNNKIDEAITNILSAKFDINPKRVGLENIGCSFCKYKDICYMREEDIVNLKEYKDFSFLGGDINA